MPGWGVRHGGRTVWDVKEIGQLAFLAFPWPFEVISHPVPPNANKVEAWAIVGDAIVACVEGLDKDAVEPVSPDGREGVDHPGVGPSPVLALQAYDVLQNEGRRAVCRNVAHAPIEDRAPTLWVGKSASSTVCR